MLQILTLILLFGQAVHAQSAPSSAEVFRKEYVALQRDVDNVIDVSVPGAELLQTSRATYIEEYGIVVTLEVALERPVNNPFATPRSAAEIRLSMSQRRKLLQERVQLLLGQKIGTLLSVGPEQSVAIVVHLFNPANVSNIPSQIVFIARKQDPTKIIVREF